MAAEVNLGAILEALELADDSILSYLDVETVEVCSITNEEFEFREDEKMVLEDLPDWQRAAMELARGIQQHERTPPFTPKSGLPCPSLTAASATTAGS
jgi:hypothetical protein